MKKLMLAMAIVAGAVSAQAATTYYTYKINATPFGSAQKDWQGTDVSYFHVYALSATQVKALGINVTGGNLTTETATSYVSAINTWILDNGINEAELRWSQGKAFDDQSAAGTQTPYMNTEKFMVAIYQDSRSVANSWEEVQYIVAFYDGDKLGKENGAFRTLVLKEGTDSLSGGTNTKLKWGSWTTATMDVPEPTSGLLMLLGVAGLALKRKRA